MNVSATGDTTYQRYGADPLPLQVNAGLLLARQRRFDEADALWTQALESFDVMFVQNEESKRLLAGLGFDNVIVAGDTRFDRVAEIAKAAKHIDVIERFKNPPNTNRAAASARP